MNESLPTAEKEVCTCSPYFGCSEYADDCPRHGLRQQYNTAVANGLILRSKQIERRMDALTRPLPPGERKTFSQYAAERAQTASSEEAAAVQVFDALYAARRGCHPDCTLGPRLDHPGYLGYRCVGPDGHGLPWPGEEVTG